MPGRTKSKADTNMANVNPKKIFIFKARFSNFLYVFSPNAQKDAAINKTLINLPDAAQSTSNVYHSPLFIVQLHIPTNLAIFQIYLKNFSNFLRIT